MIECVSSNILYRNPQPHLRAVHTWHPSLVSLNDGSLVASFDLGEAVESLDYRTYLAGSTDEGQTWSEPRRLFEDTCGSVTTHSVRLGRTGDGGRLIAFGGRFYRDDPNEGLVNRANLGYVKMDLILLDSRDRGRTWNGPTVIDPPLTGPAFETCHSVIELQDGRLLAPTSTWKGWDGDAPNGMKSVALVSSDGGRSWPDYLDVMDDYAHGIIHWEQSIVQMADGRLLVVAWAFDENAGKSLPTPYAISPDCRSFSKPRLTGLNGETAKLIITRDGRILCLYRRSDRSGLWANLSEIRGDEWINLEEACVWSGAKSGITGQARAGEELSALKFGYPSMVSLPDGDVLAAFWCCEDCINNVRTVRIRVR